MIRCRGIPFRDEDDAFDYFRQREIDDEAEVERLVRDSDWWAVALVSVTFAGEAASALARAMANLDAACKGCPISRDAVFTALSNLQKRARLDARNEL